MFNYVVRRILATIPVMVVVALFVFSLLFIAPGDPAAVIAGDQATPEQVERIRESLGLDRPFLVQFSEWGWRLLHADLGRSIFTNLPVTTMIAQRVEPTLSLMLITLILSVIGWTGLARVVRGRFLSLREEDFVLAARLSGARQPRITRWKRSGCSTLSEVSTAMTASHASARMLPPRWVRHT